MPVVGYILKTGKLCCHHPPDSQKEAEVIKKIAELCREYKSKNSYVIEVEYPFSIPD